MTTSKSLARFNQMVRDWANAQPAKYRKSALAFGFPCDMKTYSFDQTLKWISDQTRWRDGGRDFASARTLRRHLPVFQRHCVIAVEKRQRNGMNASSVYHINFDRCIGSDDLDVNASRSDERDSLISQDETTVGSNEPTSEDEDWSWSPPSGQHDGWVAGDDIFEDCPRCISLLREYSRSEVQEMHCEATALRI